MAATEMLTVEGSCIRLPVQEADYSLTRGALRNRVFSLFTAAAALLYLLTPLLLTGGRVPKALRSADGDIERIVAVVLVIATGFLVLFTLAGWAMTCSLILGFFSKHVFVELRHGTVVVHSRRGPWRRTRRLNDVSAIGIRPAQRVGRAWLETPLEMRKCNLFVERGHWTRASVIVEDRPYSLLKELAANITEMLASGDRACELHDEVDPSLRQRDVESPPRGVQYQVECRDGNAAIVPVEQKGLLLSLLSNSLFRSGIWMALLPYPLFVGMINLSPEVLGFVRPMAPKLAIGGLAYGLSFMAAAWYLLSLRQSYLVTSEHLVLLTDVCIKRWSKSWKRSDVAAVRVGQRVGDQGRVIDIVELVLRCGQAVALQRGTLENVQYLATVLRRELGVGVEPPATAPGVAADPPEKCPFVLHRGHGRVGATKAAEGWTASRRLWALMGFMMATGSVVTPVVRWKQWDGDACTIAVLCAVCCGLLGSMIVLCIVLNATLSYRLWLDTVNGLDFVSSSALGVERLRLRRGEIKEIVAEPVFRREPNGLARVVVIRADGKRKKLADGSTAAMRYLADALKQVDVGQARNGQPS